VTPTAQEPLLVFVQPSLRDCEKEIRVDRRHKIALQDPAKSEMDERIEKKFRNAGPVVRDLRGLI